MAEFTVLYVTDDLAIYAPKREDAPMVEFLARAGFSVLMAESGKEAESVINARAEKKQQIDVLITDYYLRDPEHTGKTVADIFRAKFPSSQIIFCTGCIFSYMDRKLDGFEGALFVEKPISPLTVIEVVEKIRDRKLEMDKLPSAGEIRENIKSVVKGRILSADLEHPISVIRGQAKAPIRK